MLALHKDVVNIVQAKFLSAEVVRCVSFLITKMTGDLYLCFS